MKYRLLGQTGISLSEIGFGTWGLGGDSYGPTDDQTSIAALHRAIEKGINFFDTSDLYGNGHSEVVLGRALAGRRDQVVISSKVGLLPHTGFFMPTNFSAGHIQKGLEASLLRLGTDYIDLYHLHSPSLSDLQDIPEIMQTLRDLQAAGKIRAFGLSARSPGDALSAIKDFKLNFSFIQINYNMIDQRAAENGLFALAQKCGVGIIARTPLCFGYLTGKLTASQIFGPGDHRANWPFDQLRLWANAPGLFNDLFGADKGRTATQLALRFCLEEPAVTTVIPGMLTPAEVDENSSASDLPPLSGSDLSEISTIYRSHTFFDQTSKQRGKQ